MTSMACLHECRAKELAALAGMTLTYSISTSKEDTDDFLQIVPDNAEQDVDRGDEGCFYIACPKGVVPGQVLFVTSPLGHVHELTVPEVRLKTHGSISGICMRCGFRKLIRAVFCSVSQGVLPGQVIQVVASDTEEEQDLESVDGDFADLAAVMAQIEASGSDDSDTSDIDAYEKAGQRALDNET